MNKLTEQEKRMYDVMGAIANNGVPIIYKGALVTKLILFENQFEDFLRETRDIDASWVGENRYLKPIQIAETKTTALVWNNDDSVWVSIEAPK
ncbi:MAG: hypothetical protein FWH01_16890 [Oscillospiraceae bacterium]|nr:hypothetical protein [Oscillospiraceae bacterium]